MSCYLFSCYFGPFSFITWHLASDKQQKLWSPTDLGLNRCLSTHWKYNQGLKKPVNFGHIGCDGYFPGLVLASVFFCVCAGMYLPTIFTVPLSSFYYLLL